MSRINPFLQGTEYGKPGSICLIKKLVRQLSQLKVKVLLKYVATSIIILPNNTGNIIHNGLQSINALVAIKC